MSEQNQEVVDVQPDAAADERHRRRGMFFLGLAVAWVGITMSMQMGLNANFLSDDIKVTGSQLGLLEAARESCGVAALGALAILAGFAEPLVGAGMLVLFGAGISCYYGVREFSWLVPASLVWSLGLHVWMPLPNSIALALAEPGRSGHRLGQIQAAGAAGFGLGLAIAWALTLAGVSMRPLYLVAAATAMLGAGMCLMIPRKIKTPGPRLVLKRKYALYYALNLLEGWRKQISICFAGFLLVRVYHTPLTTLLALMGAVQAIGYFASPAVGRLIDRAGERKVLVFYYLCLTVFFVGYATVHQPWVLYAIYVVDNAFFVFAMSLTTYVNRIAPKRELTLTLSMGVAMNHVAAVTMPLVGGLLLVYLGYQYAFVLGVAAAFLSVLTALRVPKHMPATTGPPFVPSEY